MTVSFMTAYWWTTVLIFVAMVFVSAVSIQAYDDSSDKEATVQDKIFARRWRLGAFSLIWTFIGALVLGFWVPVFVPGLY